MIPGILIYLSGGINDLQVLKDTHETKHEHNIFISLIIN